MVLKYMRFCRYVCLVSVLTLGCSSASSSAPLVPSSGDRSIVGDPSFNANNLSSEMRTWYDRLKASMAASESFVEQRAGGGNLYFLGRDTNEQITALIAGLRATGSLEFLVQAAKIMEVPRKVLRDAYTCKDLKTTGGSACVEPTGCSSGYCCTGQTDGYKNWLWLEFFPKDNYSYPSSSNGWLNQAYYCQDKHPMDEAMTHGGVALLGGPLASSSRASTPGSSS